MSDVRSSRYSGQRFPAEVIGQAVWLYFRFPLSLRMVEYLMAAGGIVVSHETVRRWAEKFGRDFAGTIRSRAPRFGDKWHLDEVVITISGQKHWLRRAIDQDGFDKLGSYGAARLEGARQWEREVTAEQKMARSGSGSASGIGGHAWHGHNAHSGRCVERRKWPPLQAYLKDGFAVLRNDDVLAWEHVGIRHDRALR